ncbi:indolepyruvate ferredoxin oxidoreductase subunit alpha [Slackia faecicanis]|uniref:Indolepyruvate oxidoreductase subunit IorA n=1 Tax=Slackia faecicanis TaxID=255723 RepID=A0A3N0AH41_9ACTN|nr:thiamine pyrophosphate-dependent enzyme [Slackia faecicanis]RNL21463.1 indolepyruvate ferredoxin oxidoreductase subunit alpha [Slackia faecicanis]
MELISGNEAIARGAWEAGASIGVAYPGTPSTETMENFAKMPGVYAEWCPNEKVAVEVGLGASAAGKRVLSTMKHVGVNVAADPLFTAAYTGVGGGFVVLAADDPGMHSSQNEQDSRYYAMAAHIPMLDPADSAEALAFTKEAFVISERFDIPVFIRSTVRVSHTKCAVETGERVETAPVPYEKNQPKWVMMPLYAKPRRLDLDERIERLRAYAETCPFNRVERRGDAVGVICTGATYQHVVEALPEASVLKLGMSWPLPAQTIADFAASVDEVYVVEEASVYLSDQVKALGVKLSQPARPLSPAGELTPQAIACAFGADEAPHADTPANLPPRPPALCPGCPHRLVFRELARMKAIVTGDIGCYTLGALAPLSAVDTCVDMGASISMAHGFELGLEGEKHRPVVAVIGDSTFAHSGITSLLNTVYNCGTGTVCILDNRTTAMTGHQGNPVNGITLQHRPSRELDLPALVRALGVDDVRTVDPMDMKAVRAALKEAASNDELSVIVFESPCVLLTKERNAPYEVKSDCRACGTCSLIGCPAISCDPETKVAFIDASLCVGCSQCSQACPYGCIVSTGGSHA